MSVAERDLIGDKRLAFADHLVHVRLCAPASYAPKGVIKDLDEDFDHLRARWQALEGELKRDLDKIPVIEQLLHEALEAYRAGDRSKGIAAIKSIESMKPQELR